MLELRSVTRSAGREAVLEQASLTLSRDTPTALLGLSPVARKTALRVLTGQDRPRAGSLRLDGLELERTPGGAKRFAWIGSDGIAAAGRSVGAVLSSARPAEAMKAAERCGLGDRLDAKVKDLTDEQKLRLAIASALAARPPLILMESPFEALAREGRKAILGDLGAMLADSGSVVVLAAGLPDEAVALGGATVILSRGRVVQAGPTSDVFASPRDLTAALATTHPSLNTLQLTIAGGCVRLSDGSTFEPPPRLGLPDEGRCTLGFRPGDLVFERSNDTALRFVARMTSIETIGGERYARIGFSGADWLAAMPDRPPEPGMMFNAFVDRSRLLLFDEMGARLLR